MSTDIELVHQEGKICQVKVHEDGGTYVKGGTTDASLNVTYNYAWFWYKFLDKEKGIKFISGKKAKDCIPKFEKCIEELMTPDCFGNGKNRNKDYWAPTAGNACYAIKILLEWAKQYPEAKFITYS